MRSWAPTSYRQYHLAGLFKLLRILHPNVQSSRGAGFLTTNNRPPESTTMLLLTLAHPCSRVFLATLELGWQRGYARHRPTRSQRLTLIIGSPAWRMMGGTRTTFLLHCGAKPSSNCRASKASGSLASCLGLDSLQHQVCCSLDETRNQKKKTKSRAQVCRANWLPSLARPARPTTDRKGGRRDTSMSLFGNGGQGIFIN